MHKRPLISGKPKPHLTKLRSNLYSKKPSPFSGIL